MATLEAYEWIRTKILALSGESYCYVNSFNDDHDNISSIHYYDSGDENDIVFGNSTSVRYLNFQVRVRDTSFETGYDRIEAIRNFFKAYNYQTINIYPKSDIIMLGNDEKDRSILICNFILNLVGGNTITI